jgi:hypothetical protein
VVTIEERGWLSGSSLSDGLSLLLAEGYDCRPSEVVARAQVIANCGDDSFAVAPRKLRVVIRVHGAEVSNSASAIRPSARVVTLPTSDRMR